MAKAYDPVAASYQQEVRRIQTRAVLDCLGQFNVAPRDADDRALVKALSEWRKRRGVEL